MAYPRFFTRVFILISSLSLLVGCAVGEYQIPYRAGTVVKPFKDFVTHNSPPAKMYDINTKGFAFIAAAADGWVRFIEDGNTKSGEGLPADQLGNNNYVWIEHPYPYCQDPDDPRRANWPGKPANYDQTCKPCNKAYCNEWTLYAHMAPKSVTGTGENSANLSVDDWVTAGQTIGVEDDIGIATTGDHLHWHVMVANPDWVPTENGDYEAQIVGPGRPELIPVVCTSVGKRVMWRNVEYTSAPCP